MDLGLGAAIRFKSKRESVTEIERHRPSVKIQRQVLNHQNHQCVYCGCPVGGRSGRGIHWDHFIPFCYGGNGDDNWVASCPECNLFKSAFLFNTIEEAQIFIQNRRVERGLPIQLYTGGSYEVRKI